jgi:DNA-binding CsgD family transcriptional regulator
LVELVESAARSGETGVAADALDRLARMTTATGAHWALGVEARSRALLSVDDTADELYRRAIDQLGRSRANVELARAHLLYGEWLLHEGRRTNARTHLHVAHNQLTTMGAEAFGERARRALMVSGETAPGRAPDPWQELTGQEAEIARLAAARRTNSEIGAQLFLSPRTVEWHLGKILAKLGVSSRRELYSALLVSCA